jgi:hypothetical protein
MLGKVGAKDCVKCKGVEVESYETQIFTFDFLVRVNGFKSEFIDRNKECIWLVI